MAERHGDETAGVDAHFFRLVATFEAAAMQQLGKIANPLTGEVEIHLDAAREAIDMLDMMRRKTEGNLDGDEQRLLEHVLYQLRMNFLDVSREERSGTAEDAAPGGDVPSGDQGPAQDTESSDEAASDEEPPSGDEAELEGS
jgi:hypothetical protein